MRTYLSYRSVDVSGYSQNKKKYRLGSQNPANKVNIPGIYIYIYDITCLTCLQLLLKVEFCATKHASDQNQTPDFHFPTAVPNAVAPDENSPVRNRLRGRLVGIFRRVGVIPFCLGYLNARDTVLEARISWQHMNFALGWI